MITNWTPVLIFLVVGLAAGGLAALWLGRRSAAPQATETPATESTRLRDLQARKETLIAQLRELEETGSKQDPAVTARMRWELELQAAEVLRELDAGTRRLEAQRREETPAPVAAVATGAPAAASAGNPFLRGYLWGAGSAGFVALLVGLLFASASERQAGGPLTGGVPGVELGGPAAQQEDPELRALQARARSNPQDLEAQLDLAQALLFRDRLIDAWELVQGVSAKEPANARALTYEAVVREAMGQVEQARALLDRAVREEPALTEAWVRRGIVTFEQGDYAAAITSWETAIGQRPDGRSAIEPALQEARLRLSQGQGAPAGAGNTPAADAGSPPAAAAQPAAEGDTAAGLRIQVDLAPEAAPRFHEGSFLFVMVRPEGSRAGPPVAVRRIPVSTFPLEVRVGPADTMMGQPFPERAAVELRLDRDGDAMSREGDEPAASRDGVPQGSHLELTLR